MRTLVKVVTIIKSGKSKERDVRSHEQLRIRNVLRICNTRPPNHTPTAISDAMTFRFHIAILQVKNNRMRIISYGEPEPDG